jgi:iron complex transport system substrate-binding protein
MKRTLVIILLLVLVLSLMVGCSSSQEKSEDLKIVSTTPSVTEILFELGCGENIVGLDVYSNYPDAALEIEKVGDFNGFDIEKVISLSPSIVFASSGLQNDQVETLTNAGLNVEVLEPTYYEDIATSITLIGQFVGKESEAKDLNAKIKQVEEDVVSKAQTLENNPSIYYVMGIGDYGNWTSGEGSFINSVLTMAGGQCITAGSKTEWIDYPVEDLIVADPDVLIVSEWVLEEDLLTDPGYKDLTAIKEGRYYYINPDIIERPGPRISEAMIAVQGYLLGE